MQNFQELIVWQKAHQLVLDIYRATKGFPPTERYGLINQMRRAAISIPANVVEGHQRRGRREFARFISIANGSLEELKYYLHLSKDLGYLSQDTGGALYRRTEEIGRMLHGLHSHIKKEVRDEHASSL